MSRSKCRYSHRPYSTVRVWAKTAALPGFTGKLARAGCARDKQHRSYGAHQVVTQVIIEGGKERERGVIKTKKNKRER